MDAFYSARTRMCADHWHWLSCVFLAMAYRLNRLDRAGARGLHLRAEWLEVSVRAALVCLNDQIADLADAADHTPDKHGELQKLKALYLPLLALALLAQKIKDQLQAHSDRGAMWTGKALLGDVSPLYLQAPNVSAIGIAGGYFDSD